MIEQGSEEWFKARLGKFTASQIYKLMSKGKGSIFSETGNTYIFSRAVEVITGIYDYTPDTYATIHGIENEPRAIEIYESIYGCKVLPGGFHTYKDYAAASPDGMLDDALGIVEVKCPYNSSNHFKNLLIKSAEAMRTERPEYYWQMMMGMMFTSTDYCDFISFDPRIPLNYGFYTYRLYKDEDAFLLLSEKIEMAKQERDRLVEEFEKAQNF